MQKYIRTKIHTCRQTDRQTNRQTDRQTDRKTEKQTDRETECYDDKNFLSCVCIRNQEW